MRDMEVASPETEVTINFIVSSVPSELIRHLFSSATRRGALKKLQDHFERENGKYSIYFEGISSYAIRKKTSSLAAAVAVAN